MRRDAAGHTTLVVCNFNPVLREGYQMGVPVAGTYKELLSSDDEAYGGSGVHNKPLRSHKKPMHGFDQSISVTLPPLSTVYFSVPQPKEAKPAAKKPAKKTAAKKPAAKRPTAKKAAKPAKDAEKA